MTLTRFISKNLRTLKVTLTNHKLPLTTWLVSKAFRLFDGLFSNRANLSDAKVTQNLVWKLYYRSEFGTEARYSLTTSKPVANDSHDHIWPRGTLFDNSSNRAFNLKVYDYFKRKKNLHVMDLGCSGGAFVRSVLEDGYTAVGLEGSDISQKLRSAEWDTCPLHLFTCDITSPFELRNTGGEKVRFDLVTAWEVLEHIPADKLPTLLQNIHQHLNDEGIFVGSVATYPDIDFTTGANYHVTLQNKEWWFQLFERSGFIPVVNHPFQASDYVRGNGLTLKDWHPDDGFGFHVVMRKRTTG